MTQTALASTLLEEQPPEEVEDRYTRQKDLIPHEKLQNSRAVVIGVGAVGRQVSQQLAAMGVAHLILIDPDEVKEVNLGPQAYKKLQIGVKKVTATSTDCQDLFPECNINTYVEKFRSSQVNEYLRDLKEQIPCFFCCVDSMEARKLIWETVKDSAGFWSDTRMNAEVVRVLTSDRPSADTDYEKSLFDDNEAFRGACTGRSTIYSASLAAAMAVGSFVKYLRDDPQDKDVLFSMRTNELIPLTAPPPTTPAADTASA